MRGKRGAKEEAGRERRAAAVLEFRLKGRRHIWVNVSQGARVWGMTHQHGPWGHRAVPRVTLQKSTRGAACSLQSEVFDDVDMPAA